MRISALPKSKFEWWCIENITSRVYVLITIVSLIFIGGAGLSLLGFNSAFQRSGALLVSFAVFSVYLNHFITKEIKYIDFFRDATKSMPNYDQALRIFKSNNKDQSHEHLSRMALGVVSQRNKGFEFAKQLETISQNVVRTEFISGFFGTLIWGFGDIPFPSICCSSV